MTKKTVRRAAVLLIFAVLISAVSCAKAEKESDISKTAESQTESQGESSKTEESDISKTAESQTESQGESSKTEESSGIPASGAKAGENYYICGDFRSPLPCAFTLPEGESRYEYGWYYYKSFTQSRYAEYIATLKSEGFAADETYGMTFLFRDDCAALVRFYDGELRLCWYQSGGGTPEGGISVAEAEELLSPGKSLSKISFHPIDVTPEGFFERTGGQLFEVPSYSFDAFAVNRPERMFEENEFYSCDLYYVKNGSAFRASMEQIASFDLDGDGKQEVILLASGPTSGIFTFYITAVFEDRAVTDLYTTAFSALSFGESDGAPVLRGSYYGESGERLIEIKLEDVGSGQAIALYENGEPLERLTFNADMAFTQMTAVKGYEEGGDQNVDLALGILEAKGYIDGAGERHKDLGPANAVLKNCTPDCIKARTDEIDLFSAHTGRPYTEYFLRIGEELYRFDPTVAREIYNMCLYDHDSDGAEELIIYGKFIRIIASVGPFLALETLDLRTMRLGFLKQEPMRGEELPFTFGYDGVRVYIDGKPLSKAEE